MTGGSWILVVEDDPALRMLYRVSLELEQLEVRDAGTHEEARELLAAGRPGLVFLDMHICGVPSDELLDELVADGIPTVVVSGTTDPQAYVDRAAAVLEKPFAPNDLIVAVRAHAATVSAP